MAEDVIDILVDRQAIKEDIDFLAKEAQKAIDVIKAMKQVYVELSRASNIDEVNTQLTKFTTLEKKAEDALKDYSKAVQQQKVDLENASKALSKVASSMDENIRISLQHKAELKAVQKELKDLQKAAEGTATATDDYSQKIQDLAKREAELKQAISETNVSLKSQIKESQAATGSYDEMNARLGQMRDAFRKLGEEERNGDVGQNLLQGIEQLDVELKKIDAQMGNFQRNVGNYPTKMAGSYDVLINRLNELKAAFEKNGNQTEEAAKEQQLLEAIIGKNADGFNNLQQAIKAQTTALQLMAEQGLKGTETYNKLFDATAVLKDEFADLKDELKFASDDQSGVDKFANSLKQLAAIYQVAEGTAALFGVENEELQKSMQRLMAVQNIANGIFELQEELKRKGSIVNKLYTFIMTGQTTEVVKNTTATGVATAATNAHTAATVTATGATTGLTVAARVLRAALIATGIGLIIASVGMLAEAMESLSDETNDAAASMEFFNKQMEDSKRYYEGVNNVIERQTRLNVARAKAAGKSEKEIQEIEDAGLEQKIRNTQREIAELKQREEASENHKDELAKIELKRQELEEKLEDQKADLEIRKNERIAESNQKAVEDQKKQGEKKSAEAKKVAEEIKKLEEREAEAVYELSQLKQQALADANKRIADDEKRGADERLMGLHEYQKQQAAIIEAEKIHLLENKNLTASERLLIEEQSQQKLNDLARNGVSQRAAILDAELAELTAQQAKFDADEAAGKEAKQQKILTNTIAANAQFVKANEQSYTAEIISLEEALKKKEITQEQYEERRAAEEARYSKTSLNNQIALNEALISNLKKFTDVSEYEQKLSELKRQQSDAEAKAYIDNNKKKQQSDAEALAKRKEQIDTYREISAELLSLSQTLITAGYEREKNAIQENIDAITKQTAAEIESVNASALSQQEKADKIAAINATAQAKKEQLEARQREIDNKKAKADRLFQVFNIVGNTAVAVTKFLAEGNIAGSIVAGVVGAIQLATLLATPIPKYAQGTDYHQGGLAIVGDGGKKEIGIKPGGEMFVTPSTPTLIDIPKGTQIFPSYEAYMQELQEAMLFDSLSNVSKPISQQVFESANIKILEIQLQQTNNELKAVRAAIEQIEIHNTSLTEAGLNYSVKKGMRYLKHIDNYFKS